MSRRARPSGSAPLEFRTPRGLVSIFDDPEQPAQASAESIFATARVAVETRGRFTLALAGGGTPRRVYERLARPPLLEVMPWRQMHVFWGDERCVDPGDPRSNERMARETFLDAAPIPRDQVHPMRCRDSPPEAARRYEALLRTYFDPTAQADSAGTGPDDSAATGRAALGASAAAAAETETETGLDLALLGLGDNGHTASLFPYSPALNEQERWALEVFVDAAAGAGTTAAGQDMWRITMTAPFINRAATVVFLVTGAAKAAVVRDVIEGPSDPERLPAQLIRPASGDLRWYLDKAAGALLTRYVVP